MVHIFIQPDVSQ